MTYKANISTDERFIYVLVDTGNDNENGTSLETAKETLQGAVDAVNALIPPVNAFDRANIQVQGSDIFSENITFPNFTAVNGQSSTNAVATGTNYTLGSFSAYQFGLIANSGTSQTGISVANQTDVSLSVNQINITGDMTTALSVSGTTDDSFFRVSQVRLQGDGSTGISYSASNGEPEVFLIASLTLEADNTTAFIYNPSVSTARSVLDAAAISEIGTPTSTTAIQVLGGHLSSFVNEIVATNAIDLQGGDLSIISNCVRGNITVAVGTTLYAEIAEFTGILTNNGTIQGRIGTQYFGLSGFLTGPVSSTIGSIPSFNVITGDQIQDNPLITVTNGPTAQSVNVASPSATGFAEFRLLNSAITETQMAIQYSETLDELRFLVEAANGIVFELLNSADRFTFQGIGQADTEPLFTMSSLGTNGGSSDWHFGTENPSGVVPAPAGSKYWRQADASSTVYVNRSVGTGTVWFDLGSGGGGSGILPPAAPTVTNSFIPFSDTTGTQAGKQSEFTYAFDGVNGFLLSVKPQTALGVVSFNLRDFADTSHMTLSYNDNNNETRINLDANVIISTDATNSLIRVLASAPGGSSSIEFASSFGSLTNSMGYDQPTNTFSINSGTPTFQLNGGISTTVMSFTGTNTSFDFTNSAGVDDNISFVFSASPDTNPIAIWTAGGANGGSSSWHFGTENPNGVVSAPAGSCYWRQADGVSTVYINQSVGTGTVWLDLGAAGSGDVAGPASSLDNEVPTFSGTGGKTLQAPGILTAVGDIANATMTLTSPLSGGFSRLLFTDGLLNNASIQYVTASSEDLSFSTAFPGGFAFTSSLNAATNYLFQLTSGSVSANIYVGGSPTATAPPGSLAIGVSGLGSRLYQQRSVSPASNWIPFGTVNGPDIVDVGAVAIFDSSDGQSINGAGSFSVSEGGNDSTVSQRPLSSLGIATYQFTTNAGVARSAIEYDQISELFSIVASATTTGGLSINNLSTANTTIQTSASATNTISSVGPNTNPPLTIFSEGADGASIGFFASEITPEGVITGSPADLCVFRSGVGSGLFQFRAAATGNIGWVELGGSTGSGDVIGPGPSVLDGSVAVFDGVGGLTIENIDTARFVADATTTTLLIDTVTSAGLANLAFRTDGESARLIIEYAQSTDSASIIDSTTGGLSFNLLGQSIEFNTANANGMYLDVNSPGATAASGFRVLSSGDVLQSSFLYDEDDNQTQIIDVTTNGLLIDSGSTLFQATAASNSDAAWTYTTTGTNGATYRKYVGTVDPQGVVTGFAGDEYHYINAASSTTFVNIDPVTGTTWLNLGAGGSSITGPGTTTVNSFVPWNIADGTTVGNQEQFIYDLAGGVNNFLLYAKPQSALGTTAFILRDFSDVAHATLSYNQSSNAATLNLQGRAQLLTGVTESRLFLQSPSLTGDNALTMADSLGTEVFAIRYLESSDVMLSTTNKNYTFAHSNASGTFTFSHGIAGTTRILTTGANTNAPFEISSTGAGGGTVQVFASDDSPQGVITANPGDFCLANSVGGLNPAGVAYVYNDDAAGNDQWYQLLGVLAEGSQNFRLNSGSPTGQAGIFFYSSTNLESSTISYDETSGDFDIIKQAFPATGNLSITANTGTLFLDCISNAVNVRRLSAAFTDPVLRLSNFTLTAGIETYITNASPVGVITGNPGDKAKLASGANSDEYIHTGASADDTSWTPLRTDKNVASFVANGNTAATVISDIEVWTDLNLGGLFVAATGNSNFSVNNAVTGEFINNSGEVLVLHLMGSFSANGLVGADEYQTRVLINGATTTDGVISQFTSSNTEHSNSVHSEFITIPISGLVRFQTQCISSQDNIVFSNISVVTR